MTKHFCDICGKEIKCTDNWSEYKLKKRIYSWYESWYEKLDVHDECWENMCNVVKERMTNSDSK